MFAKTSSDVVVQSPTSFVGATRRIWKLTRVKPDLPWLKVLTVPAAIVLVLIAWVLCAVWLVVFGILLVPWRLLRRGQRRRKQEEMRHRELVAAAMLRDKP